MFCESSAYGNFILHLLLVSSMLAFVSKVKHHEF